MKHLSAARKIRAHISGHGNTVYLRESYMSNESIPEARVFIAPPLGGYVQEYTPGSGGYSGSYSQICDGLSHRGSTLHLSNNQSLIDLIRSEHRNA